MHDYLFSTAYGFGDFSPFGFFAKISIAALLGAVIGLEREWSGKPAGLRTNMLICVGATLFTTISMTLADGYVDFEHANADAARIAAQIVSGVGFLGAGTIIQSRGSVTGLTTAATMWVVAAIGMAVGVEAYMFSIGTAAFVLLALILLRQFEFRLINQATSDLEVRLKDDKKLLEWVEKKADEKNIKAVRTALKKDKTGDMLTVSYEINGCESNFAALQTALIENAGVYEINVDRS